MCLILCSFVFLLVKRNLLKTFGAVLKEGGSLALCGRSFRPLGGLVFLVLALAGRVGF